ncbi:fumarate hydratase [Candidatus Geothermarchaeota archaeon]|nr:MAG: fumarate hydratase [Candidatus Geothermarchaeota archaeon]
MSDLARLTSEVIYRLIELSVTTLPDDVLEALKRAFEDEEDKNAKRILKMMIENAEYAKKRRIPLCQDTGVLIFYLKAGRNFLDEKTIFDIIIETTKKATNEIPLRPNAVDPFTNKNSGDNTGEKVPIIYWEFSEKPDILDVLVVPKGGGSENMCRLYMLTPVEGIKGVKRVVLKTIVEAGGKPCPPLIIGVGIGGSSEYAMFLAKKAIFRPIHDRNPRPEVSKLEEELLKIINETGIGPMGLGGKTTALSVKVEWAYRHVATFPVGIAIQCWAARKAHGIIHSSGKVEIISHKVEEFV